MAHNHASHTYVPPSIPIVVQVGFAGSRNLFNLSQHRNLDPADLEAQAYECLLTRLAELGARLGLSDRHVLCGISQIAVGADTLFTRACQALGFAQRVLLPQHRDDFLSASSPDGVPDFTQAEENAARELLGSPHIIEERVVSHARDRDTRFEEANSAIVRESDVVLCLVREGAQGKPGGTDDLIARAELVGKPVVTLFVSIEEGKVKLSDLPSLIVWTDATHRVPPTVPNELAGLRREALGRVGNWPTAQDFIKTIKDRASDRSRRHGIGFRNSAIVIIVCHVTATLAAILAGKLFLVPEALHWGGVSAVLLLTCVLLPLEFMLLIVGASYHYALHRGGHVRVLAVNRLIAEIMRSMARIRMARGDFEYLLALPVPKEFGPLLRTCAILLLCNVPDKGGGAWTDRRDDYVHECLTDPATGQVSYYGTRARKAKRDLGYASYGFWIFTALAVVMALAELYMGVRYSSQKQLICEVIFNAVAAFSPVVAVGWLTWAAASDLQGRAQTFAEMKEFLDNQRGRFGAAASEREFVELVRETEARLLSENLNWYWRRAFASVG
jgi:hypothetical protein